MCLSKRTKYSHFFLFCKLLRKLYRSIFFFYVCLSPIILFSTIIPPIIHHNPPPRVYAYTRICISYEYKINVKKIQLSFITVQKQLWRLHAWQKSSGAIRIIRLVSRTQACINTALISLPLLKGLCVKTCENLSYDISTRLLFWHQQNYNRACKKVSNDLTNRTAFIFFTYY